MKVDDKKRANIQKGLRDFELWLLDALRNGIATMDGQTNEFWQSAAARLKDAEAGAAANLLREIPVFILPQKDWANLVLQRLADIYLLTQSFKDFDTLPSALQDELLVAAGVTITAKKLQEDVEAPRVKDTWQVLGQKTGATVDAALRYRRVWLMGKTSGLYALLLDYEFGSDGYKMHYTTATEWQAELIYYPGNAGLRALVHAQQDPPFGYVRNLIAFAHFAEFQAHYAQSLADAPFLQAFPCAISHCTPIVLNETLYMLDVQRAKIPVAIAPAAHWKLLAISGNNPITVFGEWTGSTWELLSVLYDGQLLVLGG